jgi:hypothetical protein
MKRIGIFGPTESGKSTVARRLVLEHFKKFGIKALILDPHTDEWHFWPSEAVGFITEDETKFWAAVWSSDGCIVVVEESSSTIKREKNLIPVFTKLRHRKHKLLVIGHSGMDLLPVMREQFDTLYLFRQPQSAAKVWAEVMTETGLLACMNCQQFEFIFHRMFGKPVKMKLPPPK